MQVEQVLFKEFDYDAVSGKSRPKGFLLGGRAKGGGSPTSPTFSEEELEAAKQEAYKKGFLEGTEEGKHQQKDAEADTQSALRQTLHNVCAAFTPLTEDYKHTIATLRTDMPRVALAAAKKAADKAIDENITTFLNGIVERCLKTIPDEPEITITVHETVADALKKHLETLTQTYPIAGHINVTADTEMEASNCKISWKDGAFLRDANQIWQNIEQAIEQLSAGENFSVTEGMEALPASTPPKENPVQTGADPTESIEAEPVTETTAKPEQITNDAPEAPDNQPPAKE